MSELKSKLLMIKEKLQGLSILYVEDHEVLRENIEKFLGMIFSNYSVAEDGVSGLETFKEGNHHVVITDLNMPNMHGIDMIEEIKKINPFVKIIIASAQTDEEHMLKAFEFGVFRYLKKPLKLEILIDTLEDVVKTIEAEENHILFQRQLKDVFHNQNQLIMMLEKDKPVLVNQRFLSCVDHKNLDSFLEDTSALDNLLLQEEGYLSSNDERSWLDHVLNNPEKLFHTKMMSALQQKRHMILKLSRLPDKKDFTILTFDDVTDLNLASLFNKEEQSRSDLEEDYGSVQKMMKIVYENYAKVKMYNFYKGLAIINSGQVVYVDDHSVVIKTTYSQLKAIEHCKGTTIVSEIFPADVSSKDVEDVDFDSQTVTLRKMNFMCSTASQRESERLEANSKDSISMFYHGSKFCGNIKIMDISLDSIKVEMNALPSGMRKGDVVQVSLVLECGRPQPMLLTLESKVFNLYENNYRHYVILLFKVNTQNEEKLTRYLHQRQLDLIKEFKRL